jgi:hypothetical protein
MIATGGEQQTESSEWLESMNIGIDKNRVAQYRKTSRLIFEHIQKGTVKELEKSLGFPKQADNFHDVNELILIHQHLNDYNCPVFQKTLAQAVDGPTSLAEERPHSSDARNKVFELVIALSSSQPVSVRNSWNLPTRL